MDVHTLPTTDHRVVDRLTARATGQAPRSALQSVWAGETYSSIVQPVDDDALMAGMAAGDQDAAAVFVRRHQRQVYGLAQSVVGDAATAEDVAQEAFTRAWRHADSYDARRASATTWLLTITRNLAIDALRLRRSDPADPVTIASLMGAARHPGPADLALASADRRRLIEALGKLPSEQRRAVVLAAIGGRTGEEVSQVEGIPLGTAKTRIRTALLRLRADLVQSSDPDVVLGP
jgi:RNA polymerase sigma factor (sigma-70 family)